MRIDVALLGRFEVRVHGRPVPPGMWVRRHHLDSGNPREEVTTYG
jgi:hypothetical protein